MRNTYLDMTNRSRRKYVKVHDSSVEFRRSDDLRNERGLPSAEPRIGEVNDHTESRFDEALFPCLPGFGESFVAFVALALDFVGVVRRCHASSSR